MIATGDLHVWEGTSNNCMQKVKKVFIMAVYLDSMWFRVDMLLTFICLARSENIRLSQLCEWNSYHECDNVVYNGHSTYFKTFLILFLHTHYSFICSVYSVCCKHRWLFNQTASSCNVLHLKLLHHSDALWDCLNESNTWSNERFSIF